MIATWRVDKDQQIYLNQVKRYVKGSLLVPQATQNPITTLAATAAGRTPSIPAIVEADASSVMQVWSMMGLDSSAAEVKERFSVVIDDVVWRRSLMNRDVLVQHIFGNAQTPGRLHQPIFLEGQQTLKFNFFNNSLAGDDTFKFALEATKYQESSLTNQDITAGIGNVRAKSRYFTPFWLTTDAPLTVADGGTADAFLTVTKDISFLGVEIIASVISTGRAGNTQESIQFTLFDAETERPLMNQPVTLNTGTGTVGFPFKLPTGWLLRPNTRVRLTVTNLITDAPVEVFFTIAGISCYAGTFNLFDQNIHGEQKAPVWHGAGEVSR